MRRCAAVLASALALVPLAASCGGPAVTTCTSPAPAGAIKSGGFDFVPRSSAVFGVASLSIPMLQLSSDDESCHTDSMPAVPARTVLDIVLPYGSALLIGETNRPGHFDVGPGGDSTKAVAYLYSFAASAKENKIWFPDPAAGGLNATSGTIDVPCNVPAVRMSGHYDLTFPDGTHIVGDFDAPYCTLKLSACTGGKYARCTDSSPP